MNVPLHVSTADGVTTLTLNRPDKRNALSGELLAALASAIEAAMRDDAVRVVVLTGAPPAFCAGLDLDELRAAPNVNAAGVEGSRKLAAIMDAITAAPKPVIAAVNGHAVAGGAALVTACDIAITSESAKFGYPGVQQGIAAAVVVAPLLRQVGERHARHMLLTGELISAARAAQIDFVNEVVADNQFATRIREEADRLAALPPAAIANIKATIASTREGLLSRTDARFAFHVSSPTNNAD